MATQEEIDAFLAHHGVLGMHWGVRKARSNEEEGKTGGHPSTPSSGAGKSASEASASAEIKSLAAGVEKMTPRDKAVLKAAGMSPSQAETMKAKYGPDSTKENSGKKGLTPAQKKMIVYGAIGLGVVGLVAYGAHVQNAEALDSLVKGGYEKEAAKAFLKSKPEEAKGVGGLIKAGVKRQSAEYLVESDAAKATHMGKGLTPESLAKFSREDLNFEPGHLFKRVSTDAEREIRESGFFASHSDADTERYKAVLPVYWKIWNPINPPKEGFVNHLAADVPIKVANEGTIYDMMKNSLGDSITLNGRAITLRKYLQMDTGDLSGDLSGDDEKLLSKAYYSTVANFTNPEDKVVKHLTQKLKSAGYHGIVDSNDAGSLAAQPVKILDGTIFKIVGREILHESDISSAQESIKAFAHMMKVGVLMSEEVDEFLAHFGVKGMHWGVRHAKADAHEYVKAQLAIGEGAGNRRKLIKAKVNARASKSPEYKQAFEEHVEKFSQHSDRLAKQARINKNVKATRKSVGKTARGVHRSLTGGFGSVSLASATIAGAAVYAHKTGLDKKIFEAVKNSTKKVDYQEVSDWLKAQGVG